ncbi:D-2-hydroxyacid dehydrogenase [Rhodobacteraceae bacterium]|jgi:phosphoglycerate dehydrogenase-like enzyme|nr:D-2-hydroxyacid dehydrogenase [Paracoccaceae bacterium]MDA7551652.1 D-2-hydroxyacid dehydrogenase [Paracoccaceae bacterium]
MKSPITILHTDNPVAATDILTQNHPDLEIHSCDSYEALPYMIADTQAEVVYSVRFAGTPGFPRQDLIEAPSVKWVSVGGSGTDHMSPWDTNAMTVTNAAGVAADMMAQYALGAMFHFTLGLPQFRVAQGRREWIAGKVEPIDGKSVLILGLGQTGQAVAARAKALGLSTIGVRAHPKDTPNVDEVHGMEALPDLWDRADFIVVCVPLLSTTRGLMRADSFAAMRPEAVIIDVSRGGVIDETALVSALQSNVIRGAALDVFSVEPLPADHVLWGFENVIITPHCSSVYDGWDLKSVEMFSDNLWRYRNGEVLANIVNPEGGY